MCSSYDRSPETVSYSISFSFALKDQFGAGFSGIESTGLPNLLQ